MPRAACAPISPLGWIVLLRGRWPDWSSLVQVGLDRHVDAARLSLPLFVATRPTTLRTAPKRGRTGRLVARLDDGATVERVVVGHGVFQLQAHALRRRPTPVARTSSPPSRRYSSSGQGRRCPAATTALQPYGIGSAGFRAPAGHCGTFRRTPCRAAARLVQRWRRGRRCAGCVRGRHAATCRGGTERHEQRDQIVSPQAAQQRRDGRRATRHLIGRVRHRRSWSACAWASGAVARCGGWPGDLGRQPSGATADPRHGSQLVRGGIADFSNGGEPKRNARPARFGSGSRPPNARSPPGRPSRRPRPADPRRGRFEPVLLVRIVWATGNAASRVFQIDHPRDELAVERQLQVFLGQFDRDGEAALLTRRRIEPVDDLDRSERLPALRPAECWSRAADRRRRSASRPSAAPAAARRSCRSTASEIKAPAGP